MNDSNDLRDLFAALAMQAMIRANAKSNGIMGFRSFEKAIAEDAYAQADAMLEVRNAASKAQAR
jgi:hypothetical protein